MLKAMEGYTLDDLFSYGKEQGLFAGHVRVPGGLEIWTGDEPVLIREGMAERYVRSVFQAWMTGTTGVNTSGEAET
jgi:hypothetical protein